MRKKTEDRLPGQYFKQSVVEVAAQTTNARTSTQDERNVLLGKERVIVETTRLDGRWSCHIQWIGIDRSVHVEDLPHSVMEAIYRHRSQIIKEGQRDKGRRTAALRKKQGSSIEDYPDDQVEALGLK